MDTQPQPPLQHPLRPYSTPASRDDFSWSSPSSSSAPASSVPPSLRYPPTDRYASSLPEFESPGGGGGLPSGGTLLKAFVTSSLLSFTGVALVQPFEVGKTLAQVQWVPRSGVLEMLDENHQGDDSKEDDIIRDESEAEAYFSDLTSVSQPGFAPPSSSSSHLAPPLSSPSVRTTDPSGYLTTITRPEWVMPIVVQGGVWEMIKSISRWKGEGYGALWKGQLTTFIYDTISTSLQPSLFSFLTLLFSPFSFLPSFTSLPLIYSPRPLPLLLFTTLSHSITSFLLSPLDLVRTRLIVQSSQPSHRKYSSLNPLSTLRTILQEEGGLKTTYFHPNLFYPTLIESLLKPLLHFSIPLVITRYFHVEPSTSPLVYSSLELLLSSTSLLLTIPIETIRKRLQLQSRASFVRAGRAGGIGKPWRSCVELRPSPYRGFWECGWKILSEETGKLPPPKRRRMSRRMSSIGSGEGQGGGGKPEMRRSNSGMSQVVVEDVEEDYAEGGGEGEVVRGSVLGGVRQLYRGLSMGVGANVVIFVVGVLAGGGGGGSAAGGGNGWAEM
ncbi:mitofusin complex protein UGO1 [Sporobolomyces salmoneus]|uniref:mitofusin complex protein UGO1 n=1 Tax=Sporobolomyces salmoneus TaxID=183962 RepID=UPI003178FA4B